jgi:uncharacterized heparinase superfamily protein
MGTRVTASHNGYAARFHVLHERDIRLASDGSVLDGLDLFTSSGALSEQDHFTLRFHLHPLVKPELLRGGSGAALVCPDGETWEFDASGGELALEESVYLSDVYGHRRTQQLVIYGRISQASQIAWQFRRTVLARPQRRFRTDEDALYPPLDD